MRLPFVQTPSTRLTLLTSFGVICCLLILMLGFQPSTGPTTDIQAWRSPLAVDPAFYVSILVGTAAYLISAWIWALKPSHASTSLFAASGLMTLMFTYGGSVWLMAFSLSPTTQYVASLVNTIGASGFGIVMTCLFIIYPDRLPGWRWLCGVCIVGFGGWTALALYGPNPDFSRVQAITFGEMICIVIAAATQVAKCWADLRQRAIAVWLAICVILGSGPFIALCAIPASLGLPMLARTNYAFASFLLIYVGLAIGLMRYKLFELGSWAFQLIFHVGMGVVILIFDAILISTLSLNTATSLGISVFLVAFLYFPARSHLWQRVTRRPDVAEADLFRAVIDAALQPSQEERSAHWLALLQRRFRPLSVEAGETTSMLPLIETEGLAMTLPPTADTGAITLRYPHDGRALFRPQDIRLAEQLVAMMGQADDSRGAYDRGVAEERTRIARDIHDNIGAQLLRALHSGGPDRKDAMIRETLTDLRDVINNAQNPVTSVADALADLRAETVERAELSGLSLVWEADTAVCETLASHQLHVLRSLIREALSNTIKYAQASAISLTIAIRDGWLTLRIADNGSGFALDGVKLGHGLENMQTRVQSLGGQFDLSSDADGTRLFARFQTHQMETVN